MNGLEAAGYVVGGAVTGSIAVFALLGRMVNQQVTKSFTEAIEGDGNGNAGLRAELKDLKADFKASFTQLNTIATVQAVMVETLKQRDKFCEKTHADLDKTIVRLEARYERTD